MSPREKEELVLRELIHACEQLAAAWTGHPVGYNEVWAAEQLVESAYPVILPLLQEKLAGSEVTTHTFTCCDCDRAATIRIGSDDLQVPQQYAHHDLRAMTKEELETMMVDVLTQLEATARALRLAKG